MEIKKLDALNPAPARSASPLWGIEDGDSLPVLVGCSWVLMMGRCNIGFLGCSRGCSWGAHLA